MSGVTILNTYWTTNIGNAFIDIGSYNSLKQALPEKDIVTISGFSKLMFDLTSRSNLNNLMNFGFKKFNKIIPTKIKNRVLNNVENRKINHLNSGYKNLFNLEEALSSEYIVMSGCILNSYTIERFGPVLYDLNKKDKKIVFLGAGGSSYTETENKLVTRFLKKVTPYALISRDEYTFNEYRNHSKYSYDGIDCGFFVNDFFKVADMNVPKYVLFVFDKIKEPHININNKLIIRAHHNIYRINPNFLHQSNMFVSESPFDYLHLYANADEVHSDRIHACVPCLSFGNPSKMYFHTLRSKLFKRMNMNDIEEKLIHPNITKIKQEKLKQINFLSEILM